MSDLDISGLAHAIVNDSGYAKLQAKAFRDISAITGDSKGASKGVRLFLEFLEKEGAEYNPSEDSAESGKKSAVKKSSSVLPSPDFIFPAGSDPDLNPVV